MSKIKQAIADSLISCGIANHFIIFNDKNKTHRKIKICGLPKMTDTQISNLKGKLSAQLPIIELCKHKNYDATGYFSVYKRNSLVLRTEL